MLTITKRFEFSASHQLLSPNWSKEKNCDEFGKCSNIHGHNYSLEVSVSGNVDPETGMILNLSTLDDLVKKEIIQQLDHKHLNTDVLWLKNKIVSLENIIESMWTILDHTINSSFPNVQLEELVLWETSRIYTKRTRNK